jgi:hypothetical protein
MINLDKWNWLPKRYQSIIAGAAAYGNSEVTAKGMAKPCCGPPLGGGQNGIKSVLATYHGRRTEGFKRSEGRDVGHQFRFQEGTRIDAERFAMMSISGGKSPNTVTILS